MCRRARTYLIVAKRDIFERYHAHNLKGATHSQQRHDRIIQTRNVFLCSTRPRIAVVYIYSTYSEQDAGSDYSLATIQSSRGLEYARLHR